MIETKIYNNFLDNKTCEEYLKTALEYFEIDYRTNAMNWHARTNRDLKFENLIKDKIESISPLNPFHIVWINLTEYENNRNLPLHTDERSNCTFTIPLTKNYSGGYFIIEENSYDLKLGDCIVFDGFKLKHGVSEVVNGYRAALNIWIKEGNKPML